MSGERRLSFVAKAHLGMVAFSLCGSLACSALRIDPSSFRDYSGLLTLSLGLLALLSAIARKWRWKRTIAVAALVLAVGAGAEVAGLYTGLPYGRHQFTDAWWPLIAMPDGKLFPLQLPLLWFIVAAGGYFLFARQMSSAVAVPLGALLATLVNLPIQWAVARSLGYWQWTDPSWPIGDIGFGVPLMNSVGWLVTAWAAGAILNRAGAGEVDAEAEAKVVILGSAALMVGLALIATASGP